MKAFVGSLLLLVVVDTISALSCRQQCKDKPSPTLCVWKCRKARGNSFLIILVFSFLNANQKSMCPRVDFHNETTKFACFFRVFRRFIKNYVIMFTNQRELSFNIKIKTEYIFIARPN